MSEKTCPRYVIQEKQIKKKRINKQTNKQTNTDRLKLKQLNYNVKNVKKLFLIDALAKSKKVLLFPVGLFSKI